jgi:hypothetical protein
MRPIYYVVPLTGLFTNASVAIDGSSFKAVNNRDKNFSRAKMERRLAPIEESVARYLRQLDSADRQEPKSVTHLPMGRGIFGFKS